MGQRFYEQQMAHFNIKSVYELGQFHRGEITKRGKQPKTSTGKRKLKADVVSEINEMLNTSITGLDKMTVAGLEQLSFSLTSNADNFGEFDMPSGRLKKPYLEAVCVAFKGSVDGIDKLTIKALKELLEAL